MRMRWRMEVLAVGGIYLLCALLAAGTGSRTVSPDTPAGDPLLMLSVREAPVAPAREVSAPVPAIDSAPAPADEMRSASETASAEAVAFIPTPFQPHPAGPEPVHAGIGRPERNGRRITALVTAYCPCPRCCGRFANGRTATGTSAWSPGIASSPDIIPYGSIVEVPGYGRAVVDDTGIAMRRHWAKDGRIHLDIRFDYHYQARQWGSRLLTVIVYPPDRAEP